ncbi:MAG: SRPBCC family protein, partial [Acidobacteria bacterium]|nr:SRPBCC family protein [Acidobacteriota bacterium]
MLKKLLIGLLALVALLVVIGFLLPDDSHVERSTVVNAPACTIYAQLVDFQRFNDWSPWAKLDPETQYTYSGSDWGAGAKMSWTSKNRNVGVGSQEIKSAEPYKEVRVVLDFGDQGLAHSFYLLTPEGEGTKVTWGFDTSFEGSLIGRYFGLFMDSMVGASYEEGLASLKTLAESLPKTDWC